MDGPLPATVWRKQRRGRRDNDCVSVPRPWPLKRPVWQLVVALVAWAGGVGFLLLSFATGTGPDTLRWVSTAIWLTFGALWMAQWRRAVKQYERHRSTD